MKYNNMKMNGYTLHLIKTDKFDKTLISVYFRNKIIKKDITIRNFLFEMLILSCKKYNTERLFDIKLEELYSSRVINVHQIIGDNIMSCIDIAMIDKKYTDIDIIKEGITLLHEIIFNPNITNNSFDKELFSQVKLNLVTYYKSIKNNPSLYCSLKAIEQLEKDDTNSYRSMGYIEDLKKITPKSLYSYYKRMLKKDIVDIFVVGNFNNKNIVKLFDDSFSFKTKQKELDYKISYDNKPIIKELNETLPSIKQSKLTIVCKALNMTDFERDFVFPIYSSILGESPTSRLFTNVREKNSLAYSIYSYCKRDNSLMLINCGIENSNYDKTLELIKEQMNDMKKYITNTELDVAKKEILSYLNSIYDTPGNIIDYHFTVDVLKDNNRLEVRKNINNVTIKDIINFSNKIYIDTIYLLKGDNNGKN